MKAFLIWFAGILVGTAILTLPIVLLVPPSDITHIIGFACGLVWGFVWTNFLIFYDVI